MIALAMIGALLTILLPTTVGRVGGLTVALFAIAGPLPAVVLGGGAMTVALLMRARAKQAESLAQVESEIGALEALSLATTAGLPFTTAAQMASSAGPGVSERIGANLRRWHSGLGIEAGRHPIDDAFAAAQRSSVTGSRLGPTLRSQLGEVRRARSERRRASMARLPVKLLFPLVFLILPGFLLLAVVPTVVGGLSRLQL